MTNKTGSTALSFTQQLLIGNPSRFVVGGQLTSYEAGTTTLVQPYKDAAATLPWPNPLTIGADGRIPLITYIMAHDDAVPLTFVTVRTSVRMRLTDKNGVVQFDYDPVPLMTSEPGTGGGGGVDTTDPDSLYKTGDMKARYGIGIIPGYVRANGLTIGNLSSGATELANDLTASALYTHLWNADANLVVLGGRGISANADFTANKQLTLPDMSGRVPAGLDNMSGVLRGVLHNVTFGVVGQGPDVLGARNSLFGIGDQIPIGLGHLPPLSLPVNIPAGQGSHTHDVKYTSVGSNIGAGGIPLAQTIHSVGTTTAAAAAAASVLPVMSGTATLAGGSLMFPVVQPTMLITFYIRL